MKNFRKMIVSAMAAVMAAAALATTAGAAEYYFNDGSYIYDGINDNKVYIEDSNGELRDHSYNYGTANYYNSNNAYRDTGACTANYTTYNYSESYIGSDAFYGNIYYRSDCGYYAKNGSGNTYLGQNFRFTEYIGTDRYGRKIYYRSEYGYIYYSGKGNTWYTLGNNINNIDW